MRLVRRLAPDHFGLQADLAVAPRRDDAAAWSTACRVLADLAGDGFKTVEWFRIYTSVPVERLQKASRPDRTSNRVRVKVRDGVKFYAVADARRWWPRNVP